MRMNSSAEFCIRLKTLEKYYIVDIGMRYMLLGSRQADAGHILENIYCVFRIVAARVRCVCWKNWYF